MSSQDMTNEHDGDLSEEIAGQGKEIPGNPLQSNPIIELDSLRHKEEELIRQMLVETRRLVRVAFEWRDTQGLKWSKFWRPPVGSSETHHISYYYHATDGDKEILLEAFVPHLYDQREIHQQQALCIVEYPAGAQNPLTIEEESVIGSSVFAGQVVTGKISDDDFGQTLEKAALAVADYREDFPTYYDEKSKRYVFKKGFSGFGWHISTTTAGFGLRTELSLSEYIPVSRRFTKIIPGFSLQEGNRSDPFSEAQRRLALLTDAKLIGMSEPPERQIVPYTKS